MTDSKPKISFVVLLYNRKDIIEKNLDRLLEIEWSDKEIIVVDNCSTDGSRELIREKYASLPEVVFIESPNNGGVCPGRNQGFRKASGDYVIYLDDDSIAPLDICEKTVALFDKNPHAGCIAYVIKSMPDGRMLNNLNVTDIGNYWGGAHVFRREIFEKAGYLDEIFFFGGEEFDHSILIRQAGYEVILCDKIVVDHFGKQTSNKAFAKRASNWMASMNFVYIKWFPWRYALPLIFRQWLSMSFAGLRKKTLSPLFNGPWITLKGLPAALRQRKVMSHATLAFYLDPNTRPNHCRIPLAKFWSDYHKRKAARQ